MVVVVVSAGVVVVVVDDDGVAAVVVLTKIQVFRVVTPRRMVNIDASMKRSAFIFTITQS